MDDRLVRHRVVSASLAAASDAQLLAMVDSANRVHDGIGGESSSLEIAGVRVFAKSVALTEVELRNVGSTRNLDDLPECFHYGIGSPGVCAWRELAAHELTTRWVIEDRSRAFPLLHHARVLPGAPSPRLDEGAGPTFWGDSAEVRARFSGLAHATHRVVMFLEHFPQTLHAWLEDRRTRGHLEDVIASVEDQLLTGAASMTANGLLHFDAHFHNILTDGSRLHFSDFGLATSTQFDLSARERAFVAAHRDYDAAYVRHWLAIWLVTAFTGKTASSGRDALLRKLAAGSEVAEIPPQIAEIVRRHAPVSLVLGKFHHRLRTDSRSTPFPADAIATALEGAT